MQDSVLLRDALLWITHYVVLISGMHFNKKDTRKIQTKDILNAKKIIMLEEIKKINTIKEISLVMKLKFRTRRLIGQKMYRRCHILILFALRKNCHLPFVICNKPISTKLVRDPAG